MGCDENLDWFSERVDEMTYNSAQNREKGLKKRKHLERFWRAKDDLESFAEFVYLSLSVQRVKVVIEAFCFVNNFQFG